MGRIHTPHGVIDTPGFVAVGTNAALKAVDGPWADAGKQARKKAAGAALMALVAQRSIRCCSREIKQQGPLL